jgi:ketosteroid isomerase-like protein
MGSSHGSDDGGQGPIRDELTALCRQWSEAMGRGDVDAIMSSFAEDAVFVIAGAPLCGGQRRFGNASGRVSTKEGRSPLSNRDRSGNPAISLWTLAASTSPMIRLGEESM